VYYAVWGALQEVVYHYRSFNSAQELTSVILSQRGNNCHKRYRSIGEWRRRLENSVHAELTDVESRDDDIVILLLPVTTMRP